MIGFSGPRDLKFTPLVAQVLETIKHLGIAVGCAGGLDKMVVAKYDGSYHLEIFAMFGPEGEGAAKSSNVTGVQIAANLGATVHWWAGGGQQIGHTARLTNRSLAMITAVANGKRKGIVAFPNKSIPREFSRYGKWMSCGSGTWGTVASAAMIGIPVIVFKRGELDLPEIPGAHWRQCDKGGVWDQAFILK